MGNSQKKDHHLRKKLGARVILDVVGSKWTISIVRALQNDVLRFHELQKILPGIRQKVLTETLRKLERNGIVYRTVYATVPLRVEYKLTPLGLDLLGLTDVLVEWVVVHEDEIKRAQRLYGREK